MHSGLSPAEWFVVLIHEPGRHLKVTVAAVIRATGLLDVDLRVEKNLQSEVWTGSVWVLTFCDTNAEVFVSNRVPLSSDPIPGQVPVILTRS